MGAQAQLWGPGHNLPGVHQSVRDHLPVAPGPGVSLEEAAIGEHHPQILIWRVAELEGGRAVDGQA